MDLELSSTLMYQCIKIWERPEIHKATFNRSYNILVLTFHIPLKNHREIFGAIPSQSLVVMPAGMSS
jgi:hypothetical protein